MGKKSSKRIAVTKSDILPDVGTIGIEELVPVIKSDNPATLQKQNDDLVQANVVLNQFNNSLMKKLEEKDAEISHLKQLLLSGSAPIIGSEGLVQASVELQMVESQLRKLQEDTMLRLMTLDDVKRLDLLIKNKNLLESKPTTIEGKSKTPAKEKTKQELLTTAARKTSQENN